MNPLSSARATRTLDRLEQRRRRLAASEYFRPGAVKPAEVPRARSATSDSQRQAERSRQALADAEHDVTSTTRKARRTRWVVGGVLAELAAFFTLGML